MDLRIGAGLALRHGTVFVVTASCGPEDNLSRAVAQMVPLLPDSIVLEASEGNIAPALFPAEVEATSDWAAHRRAQFAAGRACARSALQRLGHAPTPILFDEAGVPVWPQGAVGSISHKRHHCVAAMASSSQFVGLGIDLEVDAEDRSEAEILRRVCSTAAERAQAPSLGNKTKSPGTLFLAAKEAFFKCRFAVTHAHLDWADIEVTFGDTSFRATGPSAAALRGVYVVSESWILTFVAQLSS